MERGELTDKRILRQVGILKLIHEYMPEALGILIPDHRIVLQQARRVDQKVVKVHGVAGNQPLLIFPVHTLYDLIPVGGGRVFVRSNELILGARDRPVHTCRAIELFIDIQLSDHSFDDSLLVVAVEDHEVRPNGQVIRLTPQDAGADRVESPEHDALNCLVGQQRFDTGLHFLRRLVGERDRQDLPGPDSLHRDEVSDPLGEDAGLAGPGARHHQDRAVACGDRNKLLFVEFVEDFHIEKVRAGPCSDPPGEFNS